MMQHEIGSYVSRGFRVTSQTPESAALVKPKKFSFLAFILLLLVGGVPGIIYFAWYLAKKDASVYLYTNDGGTVTVNASGGTSQRTMLILAGILIGFVVLGMLI